MSWYRLPCPVDVSVLPDEACLSGIGLFWSVHFIVDRRWYVVLLPWYHSRRGHTWKVHGDGTVLFWKCSAAPGVVQYLLRGLYIVTTCWVLFQRSFAGNHSF